MHIKLEVRRERCIVTRSDRSRKRASLWALRFVALCAALLIPASLSANPIETVLASLCPLPPNNPASCTGGASPTARLFEDSQGNLYGTTLYSLGIVPGSGEGAQGCGMVFELSPPATPGGSWAPPSELHIFQCVSGKEGGYPMGGLISDGAGNLYGTTSGGGTAGFGTVYELLRPSTAGGHWQYTQLHAFKGGSGDGATPVAGLIFDSNGNLYGTTLNGGSCPVDPGGCGTVFELSPPAAGGADWTPHLLYAFQGGSDGAYPSAGVIFDSNGNLYSTAQNGGDIPPCPPSAFPVGGCGVVFELRRASGGGFSGTTLTLYAFQGSDGANPEGVIFSIDGNLYGTTIWGGTLGNETTPGTARCSGFFRLPLAAEPGPRSSYTPSRVPTTGEIPHPA